MPADLGQTEFYLRWLDKYERKPWEESPIGLIFVFGEVKGTSRIIGPDGRDIKVADY